MFCVRRAEWLVVVVILAGRRDAVRDVFAMSNLRHCKRIMMRVQTGLRGAQRSSTFVTTN